MDGNDTLYPILIMRVNVVNVAIILMMLWDLKDFEDNSAVIKQHGRSHRTNRVRYNTFISIYELNMTKYVNNLSSDSFSFIIYLKYLDITSNRASNIILNLT